MLILVQLFSDRLRNEQLKVQEELSQISELIQEDMSGIAPKSTPKSRTSAEPSPEQSAVVRRKSKLAKTRNTCFRW